MQLIPHRSPLFPYTTLFRSCLPLTAPSSPRSQANRAASRDSADAPLRGRLEGPVVRPPRSPDHSRGARVHPYRLAAVPARPTRAVLPVRGLRCGCPAGLALPPQPPALRPAAGDAGGSLAAPFRGGTGAGAAPGRAPGDRRAAAAQPRRPVARRGARRAHTAGADRKSTRLNSSHTVISYAV